MKLPDFAQFEPLNVLLNKMRVKERRPLHINLNYKTLTSAELEILAHSGKDIDDISEIKFLPDGTLTYKNCRVLLYIRDVDVYVLSNGAVPDSNRKFHLVNCKTLQFMRDKERFGKYVVATKNDGRFLVKRIDKRAGTVTNAWEHLNVCRYCLDHLRFDDYSSKEMSKEQKAEAVLNFKISKFFEQYPITLHTHVPRYSAENAPVNTYTPDWHEKSKQTRIDNGWKCESCHKYFGEKGRQELLHVHHKNGLKWDNSKSNLQVLCKNCHANQDFHGHMKPQRGR